MLPMVSLFVAVAAEDWCPMGPFSKWCKLPEISVGVAGHAAATLAGRIFVIGGTTGDPSNPNDNKTIGLANVSVFSPDDHAWCSAPTARLNTPRYALAAASDEASLSLYALGGASKGQILSTVEVLDFQTASWSNVPPMKTARASFAAAFANGLLYVVGGVAQDGEGEPAGPQPSTVSSSSPEPQSP